MMREFVQMSGPPTELIFGDWYPTIRTGDLRAGKTAKALLLGVPLLVGRKNDGKLFAMRDLCPHRGIPLSAGWFDGETVELPGDVDHGISGLMGPAQGPFVHQAWWARSRASIHEKTKHFEPIEDAENKGRNAGFRMSSHAPSANSAPYKLLGIYGVPI